ncbi:MAG TPA: hypothetical protein PKA60_02795 [Candidatus Paceibacterota bacterium]|nr:hypothetical protein [Candidatus Paceibacterota bacterium]
MSIEFEEDNQFGRQVSRDFSVPNSGFNLVNFLIEKGIVKDEKKATTLIVVISLLVVLLSIYLSYNILSDPKVDNRSYSELSESEKMKIPEKERLFFESLE